MPCINFFSPSCDKKYNLNNEIFRVLVFYKTKFLENWTIEVDFNFSSHVGEWFLIQYFIFSILPLWSPFWITEYYLLEPSNKIGQDELSQQKKLKIILYRPHDSQDHAMKTHTFSSVIFYTHKLIAYTEYMSQATKK